MFATAAVLIVGLLFKTDINTEWIDNITYEGPLYLRVMVAEEYKYFRMPYNFKGEIDYAIIKKRVWREDNAQMPNTNDEIVRNILDELNSRKRNKVTEIQKRAEEYHDKVRQHSISNWIRSMLALNPFDN